MSYAFIINPNENQIDNDLEKSDSVSIFHNLKSRKEFLECMESTLNLKINKVVYIHYYSFDNTYTVGLKNMSE